MFGSLASAKLRGVRHWSIAIGVAFACMHTPAFADEASATIRIGGTGTALGGMTMLGAAFSAENPGVHVVVLPSLGSGGGIKALAAGKIDVAVSARPLKDSEVAEGLRGREYARTPIIFATRHDNDVKNVTLADLIAIYSGTMKKWPNGSALRLVMRPPGESDTQLLRDLSPEMDVAVSQALERPNLFTAINDQDNAAALEDVPGSIGLTTLAQVLTENRQLNEIAFNGIAGTTEDLINGTYAYYKQLHLIVAADPAPTVSQFVDFMNSTAALEILRKTGHVPIDADGAMIGEK